MLRQFSDTSHRFATKLGTPVRSGAPASASARRPGLGDQVERPASAGVVMSVTLPQPTSTGLNSSGTEPSPASSRAMM
jgi:hypothetical protein